MPLVPVYLRASDTFVTVSFAYTAPRDDSSKHQLHAPGSGIRAYATPGVRSADSYRVERPRCSMCRRAAAETPATTVTCSPVQSRPANARTDPCTASREYVSARTAAPPVVSSKYSAAIVAATCPYVSTRPGT